MSLSWAIFIAIGMRLVAPYIALLLIPCLLERFPKGGDWRRQGRAAGIEAIERTGAGATDNGKNRISS